MEVIPEAFTRVAQELRLPVEGLMHRSLKAFLLQEMRAAQMDMSDYKDRYGVNDSTELRARIERREVYSHPAWEDAIEWEQLEAYIQHLEELLSGIKDV